MTTKAQRKYLRAVAAMGCVICGAPAEVHHVRREGAKRDHYKVICLCPRHHRTGGRGVAIHAGRESWEAEHGAELDWLAVIEARMRGADVGAVV